MTTPWPISPNALFSHLHFFRSLCFLFLLSPLLCHTLSSMALQDITNAPAKFRLHVDIDRDYATLRSARIAPNVETMSQMRMQGYKALDLWTDGGMYPKNPITQQPPPFHNLTTLLRFVGDGFNGMLGYCNSLWSVILHESGRRMELQAKFDKLQETSNSKIKALRQEIVDLTVDLTNQISNSDKCLDNFLRVSENIISLQNSTRNMHRCIDYLTHLPMGCVLRTRKRKCADLLAKKGGALKRRVRVTRALAGSMLGMEGAGSSTRVGVAKHVLRCNDIITMLEQPSYAKVWETLRQWFYKDLVGLVTPQLMLETCDVAGISRKGYESIYRVITLAHRAKGFIRPMLPTPYSISMARASANLKVATLLGGYRYVSDGMPLLNGKSF